MDGAAAEEEEMHENGEEEGTDRWISWPDLEEEEKDYLIQKIQNKNKCSYRLPGLWNA